MRPRGRWETGSAGSSIIAPPWPGTSTIHPARKASDTASSLECTPSFSSMLWTWLRTVARLRSSSCAISLFWQPGGHPLQDLAARARSAERRGAARSPGAPAQRRPRGCAPGRCSTWASRPDSHGRQDVDHREEVRTHAGDAQDGHVRQQRPVPVRRHLEVEARTGPRRLERRRHRAVRVAEAVAEHVAAADGPRSSAGPAPPPRRVPAARRRPRSRRRSARGCPWRRRRGWPAERMSSRSGVASAGHGRRGSRSGADRVLRPYSASHLPLAPRRPPGGTP